MASRSCLLSVDAFVVITLCLLVSCEDLSEQVSDRRIESNSCFWKIVRKSSRELQMDSETDMEAR